MVEKEELEKIASRLSPNRQLRIDLYDNEIYGVSLVDLSKIIVRIIDHVVDNSLEGALRKFSKLEPR